MNQKENTASKERVDLTGVPETMLQTLYARAAYSKKQDPRFYDVKSLEIASWINYDFSAAEKDTAMSSGVLARTVLLDRMVKDFIQAHPNCTIYNIAAGMDTRFWRVDNGIIHWIDVDLPETIAVRKKFLAENDRLWMKRGLRSAMLMRKMF